MSVGAGHVGDATDLALTPEQAVVVKFWNSVKVDGVNRDDASFPQTGECGDDNVSAGREGDGAI